MSKSFYINGIQMDGLKDDENFDINISNTTTTKLFPSGASLPIANRAETGNVAPDILGSNSRISLTTSDSSTSCKDDNTCQVLNSRITSISLKDYILTINSSDMVGTSNMDANLPRDSPLDSAKNKFYDQMQPAWLICYTTLSGINYIYQPSGDNGWNKKTNSSIIQSGSNSNSIDITTLIKDYHPIMLYVVANNGYALSGMPKQLVNANGVITDTSVLNDNRYYSCSDLPNGNEYGKGGILNTKANGPDGTVGQLMVPVVDPTNNKLPERSTIPTLQFRNIAKGYDNRIGTSIKKEMVDSKNPSIDPSGGHIAGNPAVYKETSNVATCSSSVVNYILKETSVQPNITANVVIGGYLKLSFSNNTIGYGNNFIYGATIIPSVMSDFPDMNEVDSETNSVKNNEIIYPHFTIKKSGTSLTVGIDQQSVSLENDFGYDKRRGLETYTNRQPKLTVLGINATNKVYAGINQQYHQISYNDIDKNLNSEYSIKYNTTGISESITKHVVMNVNFIKVKYDFYGNGPIYALFEGMPKKDPSATNKDKVTCINVKDHTACVGLISIYQMYQNGIAWRIVRVNNNTKWELQKISGNPDFVKAGKAIKQIKPGLDNSPYTWTKVVTSDTTTNMVTPITHVYTNIKNGSKFNNYTSTTWTETEAEKLRIEQVGTVEEV
tara:strand:+ start:4973 stop:6976 length:2004 start_codon:yes stop_codon:yes gene_type:complete